MGLRAEKSKTQTKWETCHIADLKTHLENCRIATKLSTTKISPNFLKPKKGSEIILSRCVKRLPLNLRWKIHQRQAGEGSKNEKPKQFRTRFPASGL